MQDAKQKWDRIHANADTSVLPKPCSSLEKYSYLLPDSGTALDIACGLGGNALFLAQHGLTTTAIDISSVAIEKMESYHHELLSGRCEAIEASSLEESLYDVVVVANFLDRSVCDQIISSIKPGGLLFYQTFVLDKANPAVGPGNPDYLLTPNELLSLFAVLHVLAFSDLATTGNIDRGLRNQSYLVAQRSS